MSKHIRYKLLALLMLVSASIYWSCEDGGVNLFSLQGDINLGRQLRDEILSNPAQFPVLPEAQYPAAYGHLRRIRDAILNSGEVRHKDDFDWEVYIIRDDNTLNAFCAPGGYIFVYTGIIKFLENEDDFAGVMGHEIAHADRRHSTDQLTRTYGLQFLLDVTLGENQGALANVASNLLLLGFSRNQEKEADEYSVNYLCRSLYRSNGAAGFFQKLIDAGQAGNTPAFLSTHPDPGNRVQNINEQANDNSCNLTPNPNAQWIQFQQSLPQ
jgi:predicted Zn-dependent protease